MMAFGYVPKYDELFTGNMHPSILTEIDNKYSDVEWDEVLYG
jgi:hypothetical protein